ncbi:phage major capsid protein [Weissella muntiaci]|uniref:Phage major capsid protein n=1 Tax=Weissella muntiaci TaxID=2508881 RepID=A0A6C2C9L8_9LACO|nr:phage major capsid protein [Weissella muntiaci]TYC50760.1 phage major capsid protein [Weissella muntiaci]
MNRLEKLTKQLAEKQAELNTKVEQVRSSADDENTPVSDVKDGMDQIKKFEQEIADLKAQIATLQGAKDLPDSETESDDEETRDDDEQLNSADDAGIKKEEVTPKKEETRSGLLGGKNMKSNVASSKEVASFVAYLKGEEVRDGVTTVDGAVVIPKQILDIQKVPTDETKLSAYVRREAVTSGVGVLPVLAKNTARLVSAAELAENPDIAKFSLGEVDYKAVTYRGVMPVSMETLQDAPDIGPVISEYVAEAKSLTEQYKIGEVLQTGTPVKVAGVDDIKDAFNKGLANYNKMFVTTESFYAEVDKMKDADGRYLLQDSISTASGKQLLGAPVLVVADDVLGKDGDMKAFVGDVKAFVIEALRSDVAVEWQDDDIFGKKLAVALRADWKQADGNAGKFLTYTPATTTK